MKIDIQIISLLYFFVFGFLIYIIRIFVKKKIMIYISNILLTLVFLYGLFNINDGIIHPYFIMFYILGIIFSKICVNNVKNKIIYLLSKNTK